ncbi:urea transporter 1 isoform X1 [Megachile rotundata]|uniref:urea transporter 1 isoform X1 n=1 Tax=Megachile rotundata TaxID=143995 RepID=UPI003FD3D369
MSARYRSQKSTHEEYSPVACLGNFVILQDFLSEKEGFIWNILFLLNVLLRGFSHTTITNNPISGLLIAISVGVASPGVLVFGLCAGFLGLLLSMLIRDSQNDIANGLTVYNPLLVGALSYVFIPKFYGEFDSFSILMTILAIIFSVYIRRAFSNSNIPYTAWPFNLAEFTLLFVLYTEDNGFGATEKLQVTMGMDNATSDATTGNVSFIGENATRTHIDWGMVFQGTIMSASQVVGVENVITGSIVYLAALLFSPITAGFAFLGALSGSLAGLVLGVEINEVYSGFWGYNTFLTGAVLGGNLFVINGQTAAATIVAITFTVIVHYGVLFFFRNLKIPVISLPFVMVASLFLKLRDNPGDKTFPRPLSPSFPEKQRRDYITTQHMLIQQADEPEESEDENKRNVSMFKV